MSGTGIVLSGGGARGAAHIGVLQALNENGIFPTHFSGASAGALIAALYCSGHSPLDILELSKTQDFLKIFRIGFLNKKLMKMTRLRNFLNENIPQKKIEELNIPLSISISNLNTGKGEIVEQGTLVPYILASCAVPLVFKPIEINGSYNVDGGLINDLPIEPLQERNLKIIGVSVCSNDFVEDVKGVRAIARRVTQMSIMNNIAPRLKQCDVALELERTFKYSMIDLKKSQELFDIGYESTVRRMEEIKQSLSGISNN